MICLSHPVFVLSYIKIFRACGISVVLKCYALAQRTPQGTCYHHVYKSMLQPKAYHMFGSLPVQMIWSQNLFSLVVAFILTIINWSKLNMVVLVYVFRWNLVSHISVWLPLLKYHHWQIYVSRDHLYWDRVYSYITLFHYPDPGSLRAEGCLHTVCHTLAWQDYSTTGSLHWHCFFCLFLDLPFPHETLLCTMTATATSNHFLFIEMLQPRSNTLYLDIIESHSLLPLCLDFLFALVENYKLSLKLLFSVRLLCLVTTRGI